MKAVCPGTFDPVTSGHVDIIGRASKIFDQVIIAVANNTKKEPFFELETRIKLLSQATDDISNVTIDSFDKLLVDFCKEKNAKTIVKGLRAISDFENEFMMAQMNRHMEKEVETVFLMASPEYAYLSSSVVKEIATYGGSIKGLVPQSIEEEIFNRIFKS